MIKLSLFCLYYDDSIQNGLMYNVSVLCKNINVLLIEVYLRHDLRHGPTSLKILLKSGFKNLLKSNCASPFAKNFLRI